MKMISQERMPVDVVPLAEKKGYSSFKELFEDDAVSPDKKMKIVHQIMEFETLNGVTKADLHAMLIFLYDTLKKRR